MNGFLEQGSAGGKFMVQRQNMKIVIAGHVVGQIADRGRGAEMGQGRKIRTINNKDAFFCPLLAAYIRY
jgi:hypothetical protein